MPAPRIRLALPPSTYAGLLGRELGSSAAITSPTYTLVHEYPTPEGPLVHIDAYRLPDAKALTGIGLDDYLERARLVTKRKDGRAQRPSGRVMTASISLPFESR